MTAAVAWIAAVCVLLGLAAGSPPVVEPQVVDGDPVLLEPDPNRGDSWSKVLCCVSLSGRNNAPPTIPQGLFRFID